MKKVTMQQTVGKNPLCFFNGPGCTPGIVKGYPQGPWIGQTILCSAHWDEESNFRARHDRVGQRFAGHVATWADTPTLDSANTSDVEAYEPTNYFNAQGVVTERI